MRFKTVSCREIPKEYNHEWLEDDEDFCWCILDTKLKTVVGYDDGEPEDQLLVRDWDWVVVALNNVDQENNAKQSP